MEQQQNIVIIGAGLTGTFSAHLLRAKQRREVLVIEKSRGTGGRASSKRLEDGTSCDIGAPYFQLTPELWQAEIAEWTRADVIYPYDAPLIQSQPLNSPLQQSSLYCGKPKMSALSRYLLGDTDMLAQTRVHRFEKTSTGWELFDEQGQLLTKCETLIITAPAAQAEQLFRNSNLQHAWLDELQNVTHNSLPQWSILVEKHREVECNLTDFSSINYQIINRVIHDSAKHGRQHKNRWVIQATSDWTKEHLDTAPEVVAKRLLHEALKTTSLEEKQGAFRVLATHRWLFARHESIKSEEIIRGYRWDKTLQLGLAGDWLCQGDIEGALISAKLLIEAITN